VGLPRELRCPEHQTSLRAEHAGPRDLLTSSGAPHAVASADSVESAGAATGRYTDPVALRCPEGCTFPVVRGIPRFVASQSYASAFGLQWNKYRLTQLDSFTGTTISRDRLRGCVGSLDRLAGASVLEAGCGAGRFTEVLLEAGARVFAFDLSSAVEANQASFGGRPGYFVCQADVLKVPAAPGSFDYVLALGMLQHTPSPEESLRALARLVRPGGQLALDHYAFPEDPWVRALLPAAPRNLLRQMLLRLPPEQGLRWAGLVTRGLLPLHRALWRPGRGVAAVRRAWRYVSPVLDYYDRFPELGPAGLAEWSYLDSHDALTDRYKHLRTPEQVRRCLEGYGLVEIEVRRGGNGIEARARRPTAPDAPK
jgi:2-polyprenyl-3-methyl-5-hydroxy-6-metoxy-1,4-benzoquinol methylase